MKMRIVQNEPRCGSSSVRSVVLLVVRLVVARERVQRVPAVF
jgi:hypothetical protein